MCINGCSLCFQTYDEECDEDTCFNSINKIVVGGRRSKATPTPSDTYNDEDNDEEEDTKYVLNQMQKSEESLKV